MIYGQRFLEIAQADFIDMTSYYLQKMKRESGKDDIILL